MSRSNFTNFRRNNFWVFDFFHICLHLALSKIPFQNTTIYIYIIDIFNVGILTTLYIYGIRWYPRNAIFIIFAPFEYKIICSIHSILSMMYALQLNKYIFAVIRWYERHAIFIMFYTLWILGYLLNSFNFYHNN